MLVVVFFPIDEILKLICVVLLWGFVGTLALKWFAFSWQMWSTAKVRCGATIDLGVTRRITWGSTATYQQIINAYFRPVEGSQLAWGIYTNLLNFICSIGFPMISWLRSWPSPFSSPALSWWVFEGQVWMMIASGSGWMKGVFNMKLWYWSYICYIMLYVSK